MLPFVFTSVEQICENLHYSTFGRLGKGEGSAPDPSRKLIQYIEGVGEALSELVNNIRFSKLN